MTRKRGRSPSFCAHCGKFRVRGARLYCSPECKAEALSLALPASPPPVHEHLPARVIALACELGVEPWSLEVSPLMPSPVTGLSPYHHQLQKALLESLSVGGLEVTRASLVRVAFDLLLSLDRAELVRLLTEQQERERVLRYGSGYAPDWRRARLVELRRILA